MVYRAFYDAISYVLRITFFWRENIFGGFLDDPAGPRRVFGAVLEKVLGRSKNILKKFCEHKNPGIMRQNEVLSIPTEGILGKFRVF